MPRSSTSRSCTLDFAPSILDICGVAPLKKTHGASWKKLAQGDATGWRTSWYYEYNYEKQFPYTPNVRGVRTDRFKYIHYPARRRRPRSAHGRAVRSAKPIPMKRPT